MLSSIVGQNERWARLAAQPTTPAAPSSRMTEGTSASASSPGARAGNGAVTGDTSSPISDGTSLALMTFGSSLQGGATSGATDNDSIASNGTSGLSRLLTDLQSLLSTFSGTSSSAIPAGAARNSAAETDSSVSNSATLSQDLQQLSAEFGDLASAFPTTHRGEHGDHVRPEPPPGPPPGSSDILNSGTVSASAGSGITGGGTPAFGNGWQTLMQQVAARAYGSGDTSSTTSALMAINA